MVSHEAMIRTEMGGGGTISLNMGPISLGIWDLGPHITREMGPGGEGGPFHYYIVQVNIVI